jgi:hypothetical protein
VAALCLIGVGLLTAGVLLHVPLAAQPAGDTLRATPAPGRAAKLLWAGLSANRPVFLEGETGELQMNFTLVSDADKVIDPKIPSSRIVINDKALADSGFILGNGIRTKDFNNLAPGKYLLFSYAMGKYCDRPGVYRVYWEGEHFRSAEVVFRVLPKPVKQGAPAPPETKPDGLIRGVVDRVVDTRWPGTAAENRCAGGHRR